ncbi:MAG: DsbA family protein [Candidatus Marsarchaeota archaeon]|nr:DsbA family protein [Candidatus Marsarchaeota archaeon]
MTDASTLYTLAALVLLGFLLGSAAVWFAADSMKAAAVSALSQAGAGAASNNSGGGGGAGASGSGAGAGAAGGVSGNTLTLQIGGQTFSREIRGDKSAPITIAEFSDFQCPYCIQALPTLAQLEKDYAGKVRIIHMNFIIHPGARLAALADECAGEQGKYWEMHDAIFAQQKYDKDGLTQTAASIGLDTAKFGACLSSGKYEASVDAEQAAGENAGVQGTPTFIVGRVINGKLVGTPLVGALPLSQFKSAVDSALN